MKILVLHTGGTIASEESENVINPSRAPIIEKFLKEHNGTEFDSVKVCNILSENADNSFYELLINTLLSSELSNYGGIIIMHGTDTLPFTSSLVSMALRHIEIPVCFIGANFVISDPRSNALDNLALAVNYIENGGKGFVVPYRNPDGKNLIHLATRLCQADFSSAAFSSINNTNLAEVDGNGYISFNRKSGISYDDISVPKERIVGDKLELKNKVLLIGAYPDIDYSVFDIEKTKPAAVIHTCYHSGTADGNRLPEFIERCKSCGADFYLCPVKRDEAFYGSTKNIIDSGAKPLYNMAVESALAKIKLCKSLDGLNDNDNLYYEEF